MTAYLIFADLTAARERNAAEATARLCEVPTTEWWQMVTHPTNGQGALVIQDEGDYGASADARGLGGLSDSEISSLQPPSALDAAGWFTQTSED